jgi:cytochrome b subunit of formate dehydrogenase
MSNSSQPEATPLHLHRTEKQYVRFTRHERVTHTIMVVAFITLALTGLTLKFSYTPWAAKISWFLGGFQTCGYLHRSAAVILILDFLGHLVGLARLRERKYSSWMEMLFGEHSMLLNFKDLEEFIGSLKWFMGKGPRPNYGRWTYWEKFDYFAVFWGVFIIGFTGAVLWFPVFFTRFLPGWAINVATIIHSDEALLATGFIFTVHFFNSHLRPEKFPMDTTIFTGRMKVSELQREKPREYENLVESGELQGRLADPYPPIVIGGFRAFAWVALILGTGIAVWIVYAMIFAYR